MYNILEQPINMYDQYDYNVTFDSLLMNNRLFCTFSPLDDLDSSFYGGALIQITHISQSSNYDTTSSLSFYSVTGSITSGSLLNSAHCSNIS